MKKAIVLFLCGALMISAVSCSCGGSKKSKTTPTEPAETIIVEQTEFQQETVEDQNTTETDLIIAEPVTEESTEAETQPETQPETVPETTETVTDNRNYDQVVDYMTDKDYIDQQAKKEKLDPKPLGAKKGFRFTKGTVVVEIYEFDLDNMSNMAKSVTESARYNGFYVLNERKIGAKMSASGKFMMSYTDSSITDENSEGFKKRQQAYEDFQKAYE